MHAFWLYEVLSTVQQTRASWTTSVRKTAPWHNSLIQKFEKSMLYFLVFTPEDPLQKFQSVFVSIWRNDHIHIDEK